MKKLAIKVLRKAINLIPTPLILIDYFKFKDADKDKRFSLNPLDFNPQVKDKTIKTNFDRHYVYHTSWAARKVRQINPEFHTDISSSLYFSGIVSAFVPVKFYDYRPADLKLSNLESLPGDLMALPFADNSINSLSCMHTIEHIGLGRYGDPIDPNGDLKAAGELKRVLAKDGSFLFVSPLGKPKIQFNAHRIYSYEMVMKMFEGLNLVEFSFVNDAGEFIENADSETVKGQKCGCGCFWFKK